MDTETQVLSDAQMQLQGFSPELRAETEQRLAEISHTELVSEAMFGEAELKPEAELGAEHQPQLDRVSGYTESSGDVLQAAHTELMASGKPEADITFFDIANKGQELAIAASKEAKLVGKPEAAIAAIETLLVIESLGASEKPGGQAEHAAKIGRTLVAEGLAMELIDATVKTQDIVALGKNSTRSLRQVNNANVHLLHAATGYRFEPGDDSPQKIDQPLDPSFLECADHLALAKLAQNQEHDQQKAQQQLDEALRAATNDQELDPKAIVEALTMAQQSPNKQLQETLRQIRENRKVGSVEYRGNDRNTHQLDEVVVTLASSGQTELVKSLLSSSPNEVAALTHCLSVHEELPQSQKETIIHELSELHQQKQQALEATLKASGANEEAIYWATHSTTDPDSAANITQECWDTVGNTNEGRLKMADGGYDLAVAAEGVQSIYDHGLKEYSTEALRGLRQLSTKEEKDAYLNSLQAALGTLKAITEAEPGLYVEARHILPSLSQFKNPVAALEAAKTYFGPEEYLTNIQALNGILKPPFGLSELVDFRSQDITAIAEFRDYLSEHQLDNWLILNAAQTLLQSEDPGARAALIIEAFNIAQVTALDNTGMLGCISTDEDPLPRARAVAVIKQQLTGLSDDVIHKGIINELARSTEPEEEAAAYVKANRALQEHGLSLDDIGLNNKFLHIVSFPGEYGAQEVEKFCSNWKIQKQCKEAYQEIAQTYVGTEQSYRTVGKVRIQLEQIPELQTRFSKAGVDPSLSKALFSSWATYSGLSHELYDHDAANRIVTEEKAQTAAEKQTIQITKQVEAFFDYTQNYSPQEAVQIVNLFGICNFMRYQPGQLHGQLESWKTGQTLPKNILVSAQSDWNGVMSSAGKNFSNMLGKEGFFCFEAGDSIGLAHVAVAIGNRERAHGRDPQQQNSIENFIINAHANAESIRLGVNGEKISTTDYIRSLTSSKEQTSQIRNNSYKHHLGSNFRIILKACSTAGDVETGKNIAESISDHMQVELAASKTLTYSVVINPDGTVVFNEGKDPTTVYNPAS